MLPILVAGWALRLWHLDVQALWWDESYSWALARLGLVEMVRATADDIHPPLYYALLHLWLLFGGESEFALRFPSVVLSLASVALLANLGRRIGGVALALIAASLAGIAPLWVYYAQETRMYALQLLTTLLASLFLFRMLRALREDGLAAIPRRWWFSYVIWAALSLWADYFPVFLLVAHSVFVLGWLALARPPGAVGFLRRWLSAQGALALLYVPWAPIGARQILGYGETNVAPAVLLPFGPLIVHLWRAFTLGTWIPRLLDVAPTLPPAIETPLLLSLLALLTLGVAAMARRGDFRGAGALGAWFPLAVAFLPVLVFLAVLVVRPFFHPRYMLIATPGILLAFGQGLLALAHALRVLLPLGMALVLGSSGLSLWALQTNPAFYREDVRPMIRFIEGMRREEDLVLWEGRYPFIEYYHVFELPGAASAYPVDWYTFPERLQQLAAGKQRVFWVNWLFTGVDPWEMVPFLLERAGTKAGEHVSVPFRVRWYDLPPERDLTLGDLRPLPVRYGDLLVLEAAATGGLDGSSQVPSGDIAWAMLRWRALARSTQDIKFSVKLVDEEGHTLAQDDRFLINAVPRTARVWRAGDEMYGFAVPEVPPGTAPGSYRLELSVYLQNIIRLDAPWQEIWPRDLSQRPILGALEVSRASKPAVAEALPIPHRLAAPALLGEVELLGYELAGSAAGVSTPELAARPGDRLAVTLFWRSPRAPSRDYVYTLRLVDELGRILGAVAAPPAGGRLPTSQWRNGETIADRRWFTLAGSLRSGRYRLEAVGEETSPAVHLATLDVTERARSFAAPAPQRVVNARVGEVAELVGYYADGQLMPGTPLAITLYWRALGATGSPHLVFLHLSEPSERIAAQADGPPAGGEAPTTSWLAGEVITDRLVLPLPTDLAPGPYRLFAGLYDPVSGQRLATASGDGRVLLGDVTIAP